MLVRQTQLKKSIVYSCVPDHFRLTIDLTIRCSGDELLYFPKFVQSLVVCQRVCVIDVLIPYSIDEACGCGNSVA